MLISSHAFTLLDYFRVPYEVTAQEGPLGRIGNAHGFVAWPAEPRARTVRRGLFLLEGSPFYASVAADTEIYGWERALGGRWEDLAEIRDHGGKRAAAVRQRHDGALLLPFDPGDAMLSAWTEAYAAAQHGEGSRARERAMRGYYALRPALPRPV